MSYQLTYGTDPELFSVIFEDEKPFVISPALIEKDCGLIPLNDDPKHPVYFLEKGKFSWMMDGVAWEATHLKPYNNAKDMFEVIQESNIFIKHQIEQLSWNGKNLKFWNRPVVNINPQIYLPRMSDPRISWGFIFGCDKDWDADDTHYEGQTFSVEEHPLRYAGGHFHIGSKNPEVANLIRELVEPMAQLCAILIGTICIGESKYLEEDKLRLFHYGKPFRYRPQEWGIEYRSPSCAWTENFSTLEKMIAGAEKAVYLLHHPDDGMAFVEKYKKPAREAILSCDPDTAKNLWMEAIS